LERKGCPSQKTKYTAPFGVLYFVDVFFIDKVKNNKNVMKNFSLKLLQVEDIQDQAPVFLNAPYSTTVTEGTEQVNLSST
jgi:hypothetical protein